MYNTGKRNQKKEPLCTCAHAGTDILTPNVQLYTVYIDADGIYRRIPCMQFHVDVHVHQSASSSTGCAATISGYCIQSFLVHLCLALENPFLNLPEMVNQEFQCLFLKVESPLSLMWYRANTG